MFRRKTSVLREVGAVRVLSTSLSQGLTSQSMHEGVILKTIFRVADKPKTEASRKSLLFSACGAILEGRPLKWPVEPDWD